MNIKRFSIKFRLTLKKLIIDIRRSHLKDLRNQVLLYLKKLPDIVHLRNLVFISTILSVIILVMFVQRFDTLHDYYQKEKPAYGGSYTEGVIGDIQKINPLFIQNDAEASACRLIFSGLTREEANNKIVPDLAQSWQALDNNTVYIFKLKKNLKWQDGKPLTADDVIFTIDLIQNPDTRTSQNAIWQNVTVQKINNYEIKFTLPNTYNDFLETATQPILPEHLLSNINPEEIKVAQFNMTPVGSGPYSFVSFDQAGNETKLVLTANQYFSPHEPYIKNVSLRLYDDFNDLYNGLTQKADRWHSRNMLENLLDLHGPRRVLFRNTRAGMKGFPERTLRLARLQPGPEAGYWMDHVSTEFASDAGDAGLPSSAALARDPRVFWLVGLLQKLDSQKLLVIGRTIEKAEALDAALRCHLTIKTGIFHKGLRPGAAGSQCRMVRGA